MLKGPPRVTFSLGTEYAKGMQLPFNEVKTTQAASRFLQLAGGKLNYMVLIKLLYMLDRTTLLSWGRPVTGDEYYSMKLGPVLSETRELITEMPGDRNYWSSYISAPNNYSVEAIKDPGADALSEAEEEIIQQVFTEYGRYNAKPFDLVELLHKKLPEWTEVTSGRVSLPYHDILKAGGLPEEQISIVEKELDSLGQDYKVFSARE